MPTELRFRNRWVRVAAALSISALTTSSVLADSAESRRLRNLGQAFYENPATQLKAVETLGRALALDPESDREKLNYALALLRVERVTDAIPLIESVQQSSPEIPHTWFNLGIVFKRLGRNREAMQQLKGFLERIPDEPAGHYNLGVLQLLEGDSTSGLQSLLRSVELGPSLAAPHFQLATAYRKLGDTKAAAREMKIFREAKLEQQDAAVPEDLEWSYYSELYNPVDPIPIRPARPMSFDPDVLLGEIPKRSQVAIIDPHSDGRPDLLVWSAGRARVVGFDGRKSFEIPELKGLIAIEPADWNDDGLVDLAVVRGHRETRSLVIELLSNTGKTFESTFQYPVAGNSVSALVWLDFDHDYDLDLFVLGAAHQLLRNQGPAGFADRTPDFPFERAQGAIVGALRIDLESDHQGADLAVMTDRGVLTLYRDFLQGRYRSESLQTEHSGAAQLIATDVDTDGWIDLVVGTGDGVWVYRNGEGELEDPTAIQAAGTLRKLQAESSLRSLLVADFGNRSTSDLSIAGRISQHRGGLRFGELSQLELDSKKPGQGSKIALDQVSSAVTADFDGDGDLDLAVIADGRLISLENSSTNDSGWLSIGLEGVRGLKRAYGAEVEVKAGGYYGKQLYQGRPLLFGVGRETKVETVRITWPNGLVQNEIDVDVGQAHLYREAQRLSGSCPMIFTWNGGEFEFITDVLGVAPLGASAGDGEAFEVDHNEVIQISDESLVTNGDGLLEIRITEELREVAFIDQIRLLAIDAPTEIEVLTNEKFKAPPFPSDRLFAIAEKRAPISARNHRGEDVRERLTELDERYVDSFERTFSGVAEDHWLELQFEPEWGDVLVLHGWVDWADGSIFRQQAQASETGLVMPSLEARVDGQWVSVLSDMGMPAGKPKTIVVELAGIASRELRIRSNLCLYWDQVSIAKLADPGQLEVTPVELELVSATLDYRGFSGVEVHPRRLQPERFVYQQRRDSTMWNPTPGMYTRFGDIADLLDTVDDRLVVMGSGDEIRLLYDPGALTEHEGGQQRSYLLAVDGWAKDGDANTTASQTVEPLPFHGMPTYPYDPSDALVGEDYERYRRDYLTRPALRLIRSLTSSEPPRVEPTEQSVR